MAQQAEDAAAQRVADLEDAAWRTRTRLEALSARTAQLETEREAGASQHAILLRERQALLEENARLHRQTIALTEQLEKTQSSLNAIQKNETLLRRQLRDRLIKEASGRLLRKQDALLLGQTVVLLLGCRPQDKPSRRAVAAGIKILNRIGLVDPDWYYHIYPDVLASGIDPVVHYLRHGALEGRYPRNPAMEFQGPHRG